MKKSVWVLGATGLALAACSQSPQTVETPSIVDGPTLAADADPYMALINDAFSIANASEADVSALVAGMPDYVSITWDEKSFDEASGATVFDNLTVAFSDTQNFGFTIEQAKLWGYDDDLVLARLNGERFAENGPLFTRMDGTNLSYFGFAVAFEDLFADMLSELDAEMPDGFEFGFDRLESTTERFVISGVSLRPWELSPLPPEMLMDLDDDMPRQVVDVVHGGQWLIAFARSFAIDTSVSLGTDVAIEMRQPGANLTANYTIDFSGAQGMNGLDIAQNSARGYSGTQTNAYSETAIPGEAITFSGFPAGFVMTQTERYGEMSVNGMKLDKLMGYLARSELPGMDEQDLVSLGQWTVSDYVSQLNEADILTAESAYFNADSFEWLIPSQISFGFEGANLNTGELSGFFYTLFDAFMSNPDLTEGMALEEQAQMSMVREGVQKAMALLPEHGLDAVPFDASFDLSWDEASGPTDLAMRFDADGFGRTEFDLGISLPTYDAVRAAYESEDREAAFGDAFEAAFAFRGARWLEQDKGGYDKLFAFANALGKEYPDQGWGVMLSNMEPPQLRTYLATMLRMGSGAAASEFPPAADWLEAYASYIETGGSIEFIANPPNPITAELIDSYDEEPEPDEMVEIFGLTVTHTN